MAKYVSSEALIGGYIHYQANHDIFEYSYDNICDFVMKISPHLQSIDIYNKFTYHDIDAFVADYSFLVRKTNATNMHLLLSDNYKYKLDRYFYAGLPAGFNKLVAQVLRAR